MKALLCVPLVLTLATAGCVGLSLGGDCPDPPAVQTGPAGRFDGQTLRILDQGAFPTFASVKDAFEQKTGATLVQIEGGDAGKALQQALLGAGNPPADILYGVDNALFFTEGVRDECLFVPYESPRVSSINQTVVDVDQFRVDGKLWVTPVDHAYVGVNYDIDLRAQMPANQLPATLRDLAKPAWAPTFVTEDPRESSPGLGFLIATIDTFGETGDYTWKDYWRELLGNGGLVAVDWTTAYVYHYSGGYGSSDPANKGDRSVVVSYSTSPAVEVFFGAKSIPGVSIEPPKGTFHQIETMGILRGTKVPDLARAWIDFCLTYEFQHRTASEMATYPVIDGIRLPAEFDQYAKDPKDIEPASFTAAEIGDHLDRWLDEWEDLYQESQS